MRNIILSIAGLLLATARVKAECFMPRNSDACAREDELYTSNAGGWN